jgi:hypothetical protein
VKKTLRVALDGTPEQFRKLRELQAAFAAVCNAIAPVVQSTRCWNRVALHHLVYRNMRERFPTLGSQMICNAVHSVSRTARLVLQHPKSPWNVNKRSGAPLPLLRFTPSAPVYFDRHTLSLKGNVLSIYTLTGRMRFALRLAPAEQTRFHREKLLEVMLVASPAGFDLIFEFAGSVRAGQTQRMPTTGRVPAYVLVHPPETATGRTLLSAGNVLPHDVSDRPAPR